jgi:uncharacterized protein
MMEASMRLMIGVLAVLVLAVAAAGQAEQRELTPVPSLTAGGRGEVRVTPDLVALRLGAAFQAQEAVKAQAQVNQVMQNTIARLKEMGIPEAQIRTETISLWPEYRQEQRDRGRIIGYRASNVVLVRLKEINRIGEVIDAAVGAGANQLHGISFEVEDDRAARQQALQRALADAHAKGQVMAAAMGLRLVSVLDVNEGPADMIRPPMPMARMAAEVATPVQPGQVQVQAEVTVRWRVAPAQ